MIPDFHDGFLDGLFVSNRQARIFVRTVREENFTIILREMERLHAENFRQGNIVFSVDFLEPEQVTVDHVGEAYYHGQVPPEFVLSDWMEKAKQKGLKAVEISTSYGCSALAFFKSYELVEGHVI
jgi:hypothetical protein